MSAIFGGSRSRSTNVNNDALVSQLSPLINQGVAAHHQVNALLGGDASNFNRFKEATGFNFELGRGFDQIGSNAAARGVLRSGAAGRSLQEFGLGLQNRFAETYLRSLLGQTQGALGASGVLASTGQESTSRSNPGIGQFLGQMAAGIATSDKRLKTDITPVGINVDGITVYQYKYVDGTGPFIGVMAQEVAEKKPEALGPCVNGHMTVDYSQINVIDRI